MIGHRCRPHGTLPRFRRRDRRAQVGKVTGEPQHRTHFSLPTKESRGGAEERRPREYNGVTPAKAGAHLPSSRQEMGSRVRGNGGECMFPPRLRVNHCYQPPIFYPARHQAASGVKNCKSRPSMSGTLLRQARKAEKSLFAAHCRQNRQTPSDNRKGARHCCQAPLRRGWICRCSLAAKPEGPPLLDPDSPAQASLPIRADP